MRRTNKVDTKKKIHDVLEYTKTRSIEWMLSERTDTMTMTISSSG